MAPPDQAGERRGFTLAQCLGHSIHRDHRFTDWCDGCAAAREHLALLQERGCENGVHVGDCQHNAIDREPAPPPPPDQGGELVCESVSTAYDRCTLPAGHQKQGLNFCVGKHATWEAAPPPGQGVACETCGFVWAAVTEGGEG